jgi:hypothetical protein
MPHTLKCRAVADTENQAGLHYTGLSPQHDLDYLTFGNSFPVVDNKLIVGIWRNFVLLRVSVTL